MRPWSMPRTRTFWTYVYRPSTLSGMSTRAGPGDTPTSLYWLTGFVPGAPGLKPWPGDGTNGGVGRTSAAASPWLEPEPVDATFCATDCDGGCDGARLYSGPIFTLKSFPPSSWP